MLSLIGRWEWLVIELIVLGLVIAELLSLRRATRRARKAKEDAGAGGLPPEALEPSSSRPTGRPERQE